MPSSKKKSKAASSSGNASAELETSHSGNSSTSSRKSSSSASTFAPAAWRKTTQPSIVYNRNKSCFAIRVSVYVGKKSTRKIKEAAGYSTETAANKEVYAFRLCCERGELSEWVDIHHRQECAELEAAPWERREGDGVNLPSYLQNEEGDEATNEVPVFASSLNVVQVRQFKKMVELRKEIARGRRVDLAVGEDVTGIEDIGVSVIEKLQHLSKTKFRFKMSEDKELNELIEKGRSEAWKERLAYIQKRHARGKQGRTPAQRITYVQTRQEELKRRTAILQVKIDAISIIVRKNNAWTLFYDPSGEDEPDEPCPKAARIKEDHFSRAEIANANLRVHLAYFVYVKMMEKLQLQMESYKSHLEAIVSVVDDDNVVTSFIDDLFLEQREIDLTSSKELFYIQASEHYQRVRCPRTVASYILAFERLGGKILMDGRGHHHRETMADYPALIEKVKQYISTEKRPNLELVTVFIQKVILEDHELQTQDEKLFEGLVHFVKTLSTRTTWLFMKKIGYVHAPYVKSFYTDRYSDPVITADRYRFCKAMQDHSQRMAVWCLIPKSEWDALVERENKAHRDLHADWRGMSGRIINIDQVDFIETHVDIISDAALRSDLGAFGGRLSREFSNKLAGTAEDEEGEIGDGEAMEEDEEETLAPALQIKQVRPKRPCPVHGYGLCKCNKVLVHVSQDEFIAHSQSMQNRVWSFKGTMPARSKSQGNSIMTSIACSEVFGPYLKMSHIQLQLVNTYRLTQGREALKSSPFKVYLAIGKNKEGYWNSERMLQQTQGMIDCWHVLYPELQVLCVSDSSSGHLAMAVDALKVSNMKLGPGDAKRKNAEGGIATAPRDALIVEGCLAPSDNHHPWFWTNPEDATVIDRTLKVGDTQSFLAKEDDFPPYGNDSMPKHDTIVTVAEQQQAWREAQSANTRPLKRGRKGRGETTGRDEEELLDTSGDDWKQSAIELVQELCSEDETPVALSDFYFSKPVPDDVEGYLQVITTPMDLGTIGENLAAHHYPSVQEFAADFMLIVTNAREYNTSKCLTTTQILKCVKGIEKALNNFMSSRGEKRKKKRAIRGRDGDEMDADTAGDDEGMPVFNEYVVSGYVGKQWGVLHVLRARGFDVSKLTGRKTAADLKKLAAKGKDIHAAKDNDAFTKLSACSDFQSAKGALAEMWEKGGHLHETSTKCCPHLVAAEYVIGGIKTQLRRVYNDCVDSHFIANLDKSVHALGEVETRKFARKARDYIEGELDRSKNRASFGEDAKSMIDDLAAKSKKHRELVSTDKHFVDAVLLENKDIGKAKAEAPLLEGAFDKYDEDEEEIEDTEESGPEGHGQAPAEKGRDTAKSGKGKGKGNSKSKGKGKGKGKGKD